MNRRSFLRSLFASSAAIVVAPADALAELDRTQRTYFDMGRNASIEEHVRAFMLDWQSGQIWTYEGPRGPIELRVGWVMVGT